MLEISKQNDF